VLHLRQLDRLGTSERPHRDHEQHRWALLRRDEEEKKRYLDDSEGEVPARLVEPLRIIEHDDGSRLHDSLNQHLIYQS